VGRKCLTTQLAPQGRLPGGGGDARRGHLTRAEAIASRSADRQRRATRSEAPCAGTSTCTALRRNHRLATPLAAARRCEVPSARASGRCRRRACVPTGCWHSVASRDRRSGESACVLDPTPLAAGEVGPEELCVVARLPSARGFRLR
jgi:hypothetical protein